MATYGAADLGFVLIDGYNLRPYTNELTDTEAEMLLEDTTVFGQAWMAQSFVGVRKAMFQINGFYDDAALASDAALIESAASLARVICWTPETNVAGKHFVGYSGSFQSKYVRLPKRHELHKFQAPFEGSGQQDQGTILLPYSSVASGAQTGVLNIAPLPAIALTDTAAASPKVFSTSGAGAHHLLANDTVILAGITQHGSAVNPNGAWQVIATGLTTTAFEVKGPASSPITLADSGSGWTGGTVQETNTDNGGCAYLQLNAFALGDRTSLEIEVQHSIDNITWVDLCTFGVMTAPTVPLAQAVVVAPGTEVYGYLRVIIDAVGGASGESVTAFVGFARR